MVIVIHQMYWVRFYLSQVDSDRGKLRVIFSNLIKNKRLFYFPSNISIHFTRVHNFLEINTFYYKHQQHQQWRTYPPKKASWYLWILNKVLNLTPYHLSRKILRGNRQWKWSMPRCGETLTLLHHKTSYLKNRFISPDLMQIFCYFSRISGRLINKKELCNHLYVFTYSTW